MDCTDVERLWVDDGGLNAADARAHLEGCERCRELYASDGLRNSQGDAAEEVLASMREELSARLAQARRDPRERALAWSTPWRLAAVAGVAVPCVALALLSLRADFGSYPPARAAVVLLALAAGAAWLSASGLASLARSYPSGLSALVLGLALPWLFALLPEAHTGHPASELADGQSAVGRAVGCLLWGTVTSLPMLAALAYLDRLRGADPRRVLAALAAGALLGNLTLQLHCPLTAPTHLLGGHATVVFGLALVLAALSPWLLREAASR